MLVEFDRWEKNEMPYKYLDQSTTMDKKVMMVVLLLFDDLVFYWRQLVSS